MKNKKPLNKNSKHHKFIFVFLISLIVFLSCAFFVNLKQNFHIDELCSYGLANNQFQMLVDDYKVYTGEQLIKDYLAVHKEYRFDIANVFANQATDTHPPLWYVALHIVCSVFVESFSKWYGLIINCFFMIVVYWLMRHLMFIITKDKLISTVIPIMSLFLNGFINAITFTRMYIMLQAVSLAFVCLIVDKMLCIRNKPSQIEVDHQQYNTSILNKQKFYLLFVALTIVGTLTQYHYMVIAGLMSLVFGVFLLKKKEYIVLIKSIISGIIGLVISYIIFPAMGNHIFASSNNAHSLGNSLKNIDIFDNILSFSVFIRNAFFGNEIVFIVICSIIILLVVLSYIRIKRNAVSSENKIIIWDDGLLILVLLTIVAIAFYLVISFTVILKTSRYLFVIYPILSIIIFSSISLLLNSINHKLKIFGFLFAFICIICSNLKLPIHLYYEQKDMLELMQEHQDIKTIMVYYDTKNSTNIWKLPYPLYDIKEMDQVVFVNSNNNNWQDNEVLKNNNNLFVYVYTENKQDDNDIISKLASVNSLENSLAIYKTSYVHLYMLY